MEWLSNLFSGAAKATGDAFNGVAGAVTDLANSDAAQGLLDIGAKYVEASFAEQAAQKEEAEKKAAQASALPAWVVPAGVGLAALLTVGLIVSIATRSK